MTPTSGQGAGGYAKNAIATMNNFLTVKKIRRFKCRIIPADRQRGARKMENWKAVLNKLLFPGRGWAARRC